MLHVAFHYQNDGTYLFESLSDFQPDSLRFLDVKGLGEARSSNLACFKQNVSDLFPELLFTATFFFQW